MELSYKLNRDFYSLQKFLSDYPVTMQRRVLGTAVRGTARPLVKETRSRYRSLGMRGLAKSVKLSRKTTSRKATTLFSSGRSSVSFRLRIIGRGDANLLEGGTSPHVIKAYGDVLANYKGGFFGKEVKHPGIRPYRVLSKSLAAALPAMRVAFDDSLEKSLDREFSRFLSGRKL